MGIGGLGIGDWGLGIGDWGLGSFRLRLAVKATSILPFWLAFLVVTTITPLEARAP